MKSFQTISFKLDPASNDALLNLCGSHTEHLNQIELRLGVEINHFGFDFTVTGLPDRLVKTEQFLRDLYKTAQQEQLEPQKIHIALQSVDFDASLEGEEGEVYLKLNKKSLKTRNANQASYIKLIRKMDVNFGIGPAGTGKTYLAVAAAVEALENEEVRRIVLTRPAVEAGEKLGFLPGDLSQKVDPYLRPLFDALFEMIGFEQVEKMIERHIIEVAPLAFMRGRTLNESFIILDEAQNTTKEQMKMFLTRIGFGSKAVITGDITQCDLPKVVKSGLRDAIEVLEGVPDIGFTFFQAKDVVRHRLVQKIVRAYEYFDRRSK